MFRLLPFLPEDAGLSAQSSGRQPPLPSEEAPPTLFTSLADEEVDIFVTGSWEAQLSAGFALTWNSLSPVMQTTSIPEINSGVRFQQLPDIIISVWLKERWFFDMSILEGYELNSIVAGYQGREDELVREVRVGNIDIGSFDSPFFPLPAAGIDSLGAWAYLSPEKSEHRTALRYDPAQLQSVTFRGMNEVKEELFDPAAHVPDRVFVLPDADVENLVLYLEDDGNFRVADASDAVVDPENGIVYLLAPPSGRVAVYYEVGGTPVGDPSLGIGALPGLIGDEVPDPGLPAEDFSFSEPDYAGVVFSELAITIAGNPSLLLHRPGRWSPFLHRGVYELASAPGAERELFASLVGGDGDGAEERRYPLLADSLPHEASGLSRMVFITPEEARFDEIRSIKRRFPLAEAALDAGSDINVYGPGAGISGAAPPWKLQIEHLSPVSSFSLEEGVLEGSVSVSRNGRDEYRFSIDYETGELQPLFPVRPDDLIEVRYRTRSGGDRGDLIFASRNDFYPTDRLSVGLDAGVRWNLARQSYTTAADQAPGILAAGARFAYLNDDSETGTFSAGLEAGLSLKNPDTTGIFRLLGMNDGGLRVPITSGSLYPAASDDVNPDPDDFPETLRGTLYYHDYHLYPAVDSPALQRYDWNVPSDQRYPYNTPGEENRIGPMVAATGSETEGDAIVFTYDDLAAGQWVGGRVPLSQTGKPLDLSSAGRIDLLIKPEYDISSLEIYLRVGDLIEDLDGDGVPDEESGPLAPGFSFNPLPDRIAHPVGRGNDVTDSEDLNGDGRLTWQTDGEDSALVWVSGDLADPATGFDPASAAWQRVSIDLSPSEREQLRSVTAFDIMIKNSTLSTRNGGTVLVADPIFVGTQFVGEMDAPDSLVISEALESRSGEPEADVTLIEAFPDQAGLFSDGNTQRTALFTWDAAGTWSASTTTAAASLGDYRSLAFFMRTPATSTPDQVTVSLTSPDGRGVEASFEPIASDAWILYTINLDSKTIDSSGGTPGTPVVTVTDRDALVSYFSISAVCPTADGELWLDEVHLSNPLLSLASSLSSSVSYDRKGSYLRAGSTVILSDFGFSARAKWDGAYGTGTGDTAGHSIAAFSELSSGLFGGSFSGDFAFTASDALFLPAFSGGYRMPFFDGRLAAEQRYGEQHDIDRVGFNHSLKIIFQPWPEKNRPSLTLSNSLSHPDSSLNQSWEAGILIGSEGGEEPAEVSLKASQSLRGTAEEDADTLEERMSRSGRGIILPQMDRVSLRTSSLDLKASFPLAPGSLLLQTRNGTSSSSTESSRLDARHNAGAAWSLPFGKGSSALITLSHDISAKIPTEDISIPPSSPLHAFGTDTADFASAIGPVYHALLSNPPDAYSDGPFGDKTADLLSGSYTPTLKLSLSRSPGSNLRDLFLPYKADLSRAVTWEKSFEEEGKSGKTSIGWSASAFNLFGRLGRYPIFSWYRTEEIASSAQLVILDSGETDLSHLFLYDLMFSERRSLRSENDLVLSGSDSGSLEKFDDTLRFTLRSRGRELPAFPLPPLLRSGEAPQLIHDSSLSAGFLIDREEDEKSLTITAGHESSVKLPGKGEINGYINGIYRRQAFASESSSIIYYTIGFEAGVGFKLTF